MTRLRLHMLEDKATKNKVLPFLTLPPQMYLPVLRHLPVRVLNGLPESAIQLLCGMTITFPLITQLSMQPSQVQRLLIVAFIQIILR